MVLNLFIPPGEGQYKLIPKRPDPLGANATLQYSIIGSTALAAVHTSFASGYVQRVHPGYSIYKAPVFIRSSGRLGLSAGLLGAAVNWYYYEAFIGVVASEKNLTIRPRKLYDWTERHTVDDGALAGAALGLVASIPTLFMRMHRIPRWTRCIGMANIGACAGLLGAHGYLQYNGERQKAYKRLDARLKARSQEFFNMLNDVQLMSQFSPLIQHFIRHNGVWHASHYAYDVYNQQVQNQEVADKSPAATNNAGTPVQPEQPQEIAAYYTEPFDYVENLTNIGLEISRAKMVELEAEQRALLREAEYLLFVNSQQQYKYYHSGEMDDEERKQRRQEIHLCEIAYNRLRTAANTIDMRLAKWRHSIRHKVATDAHPAGDDPLDSWLSETARTDYEAHDPTLSLQEMEKFHTQIVEEIKMFEAFLVEPGHTEQQLERCRKDLEDANILRKAIDTLTWELEKAKKKSMETREIGQEVKAEAVPIKKTDDKAKPGEGGFEADKS